MLPTPRQGNKASNPKNIRISLGIHVDPYHNCQIGIVKVVIKATTQRSWGKFPVAKSYVLEKPLSLRRPLSVLLVSAVLLCAPLWLFAQDSGEAKAEAFSGYSGYRSGGTVNGTKVPDFTVGWANQFIFHASHWTGFLVDVNGHYNSSASALDLAFGPRFQYPLGHFIPFGELLAGVQHFSPKGLPSHNAASYIVGVGVDVKINSRVSFRPFQLSFINSSYSVFPAPAQQFNGVRVQSGMIYRLGATPPGAVILASCSAEPLEVDAGTAVKIGVTTRGFSRKRTLRYSYTSTGGAVAGSTEREYVDTTGLKPGVYTVSARITDSRGAHQQTAGCDAKFTVNARTAPPDVVAESKPPSISPVTSAEAKSPSIAPVASAQESPKSADTKASTTATTAPTASTTADTVKAQPVPVNAQPSSAQPQPLKFAAIEFKPDPKRPAQFDNQARVELDRYANVLAAAPDLKGVVVGHADAKAGKQVRSFAAKRAADAKDYLVKEKGIDATRIQPRVGRGGSKTTELWIVPAGASFAAERTTAVDESKVKPVTGSPLKSRNAQKNAKAAPSGMVVPKSKADDASGATASAQPVPVNAQPLSALPQPSKFGTIEFRRDVKRPTRVDNEAKGLLDRYGDDLAAKPEVNGVVVGYAKAREQLRNFAARRAVNTKDYLTKDKSIDPTRIQPRTGRGNRQQAELWIVPAGTTFAADTVVDESKIRPVTRIPSKKNAKAAPSVAVASESHKSSDTKSGDTSATTASAQPSKFGTIEFKRDVKRPTRVDNEAKGLLDRYGDDLAAKPEVNGVVVGYAKGREHVHSFAAQRAVNAKDYLTKQKGIDPARIQPCTGRGNEQKAELWIVPAGSNFAAKGSTVVDESKIKPVTRVPLKRRSARKKVHGAEHASSK